MTTLLDTGATARAARLAAIVDDPLTMTVIAQRLMDGETVKAIARAWDISHGALSAWICADKDRYETYCRAQAIAAHHLVEETIGIADTVAEDKEAVLKARLRVDTRLKVAAAHCRDRYGEAAQRTGPVVQVVVERGGVTLTGGPHTGGPHGRSTVFQDGRRDAGDRDVDRGRQQLDRAPDEQPRHPQIQTAADEDGTADPRGAGGAES